MTKEIKKETDWLGREKDVIYENGEKVGETRHEKTLLGNPIDRTYDKDGNRVSETRHKTTLFGTSKEATYEPGVFGNKISETKYEEGIFGGKKGVIYEHGKKIGKLKTEKGIFGGRKQVLHEASDDVDLTRRVARKSYTTRDKYSYDSSSSQLETKPMSALTKWVIGLGVIGIVSIGLRSYVSNSQKKLEVEVAKKYDLDEKSLVSRLKWNVSQAPSLKPWESYDGSDAIRDFDNPDRNVKTTSRTEEGLKNLAKLIRKNKGWCVTITDYAQGGDDIWATGIYSNMGGGFICYSPNHGDTWFRQWYSEAWNKSNNFQGDVDDVPFRIYFFDSKEGWSFTRRKILHTLDGGRTWEQSCGEKNWFLRQLHIIDRKVLVAENIIPSSMLHYTSDGGKNWKVYSKWKPDSAWIRSKIKPLNGTDLFVYSK